MVGIQTLERFGVHVDEFAEGGFSVLIDITPVKRWWTTKFLDREHTVAIPVLVSKGTCPGVEAANLYRREPRLTMAMDFVILVEDQGVAVATEILESIGLNAGVVHAADLAGGPRFAIKRKSTPPCMVVGRKENESSRRGADLLLPENPWVEQAAIRAQNNLVDFGFGEIPVLTDEDVVLAKLYALQSADLRAKDLNDLQSIFSVQHELNIPYIAGQMNRLNLTIPEKAKALVLNPLLSLDKHNRRSRKEE